MDEAKKIMVINCLTEEISKKEKDIRIVNGEIKLMQDTVDQLLIRRDILIKQDADLRYALMLIDKLNK